jgi:hypothetical protein
VNPADVQLVRLAKSAVSAALAVGVCAITGIAQQPSAVQGDKSAQVTATRPASSGLDGTGRQVATQPSSQPTTRPATAELPAAAFEDLALLVKTARRAFREKVEGLPERELVYRPTSLAGKSGIVHVTLRSQGAVTAEAESRETDVLDAAVAAGVLLGQAAMDKKAKVPQGGDDLGLEFEWLGPRQHIDVGCEESGRWSEALLHSFEPGVEGIGVERQGRVGWTRPSQVISLNYTPDLALRGAETAAGVTHADKLRHEADIRYFKIRSHHLWQPSARVLPEILVRGEGLVQGPVEAGMLDAAIARMGAYLHYRQNRDGWFSHEYLPSPERYGEGNSAPVQVEALYGLARYALWSGRTDLVVDVQKGVRKSALFLRPLSVVAGVSEQGRPLVDRAGLVLAFPGHESQLEVSAKLLLSFLELDGAWRPEARVWEEASSQPSPGNVPLATAEPKTTVLDAVVGLVQGLLVCQDADGRLEMTFSERRDGDPDDAIAGGWGLLALGQACDWSGWGQGEAPASGRVRPAVEQVLHRALACYRPLCLSQPPDPEAAAILARAFALAYARTNDAQFSDFVFEILDRFADLQVDERVSPWPELWGAINARDPGRLGVDTAAYLAAMADGLALAERIGDTKRAERYRGVVAAAARFILQLEIRETGSYYIRSPRDAVGGVRTAPWDNRIRVDHCASALLSLMKSREVLFGHATSRQAADR